MTKQSRKTLSFSVVYKKEIAMEVTSRYVSGGELYMIGIEGVTNDGESVFFVESDTNGNGIIDIFETHYVASQFLALKRQGIKKGLPKVKKVKAFDLVEAASDMIKSIDSLQTLKVVVSRDINGQVIPVDLIWSSVMN